MNNSAKCPLCMYVYDDKHRIPLVLPCGDSICMSCLLPQASNNEHECSICRSKQRVSYSIIRELPINKALLLIISQISHPIPLNLEENQNLRVSGFEEFDLSRISPYLESQDDLKCKREGCSNQKYTHLNVIYEYCGVECFNQDKAAANFS
jgi:hypothetical protein